MKKAHQLACVTGASGMIGSRIVKKLVASGYRVRALSRHAGTDTASVSWLRGDLTDESILKKFLHQSHLLFHCAAELNNLASMVDVNVRATGRLLELAHNAGVEYCCYLSSAGVVGKTDELWVDETCPCNPQNPYEESKLQAESLVCQYQGKIRAVILRPTIVVDAVRLGPLALPVRRSWLDRLSLVLSGGECAHVVHAEDVAAAALFFISHPIETPGYFIVSYDQDPLNTFSGLWALCDAFRENRPLDQVVPKFHLPLMVPSLLRRLKGGGQGKGNVRYSAERLLSTGFTFPFGLTGAVRDIMSSQASQKHEDTECSDAP
jgi:nucleoside-diphosphate-sugar epimerase